MHQASKFRKKRPVPRKNPALLHTPPAQAMPPLLGRRRGGATGDACAGRWCGRCACEKPGPVHARPPCTREWRSLRCHCTVRTSTPTGGVGVPGRGAGAPACMERLYTYLLWPREASQVSIGAGNAAWLRVQYSWDLHLSRPWLAVLSALGGGTDISLCSNHFATLGECSAGLLGHRARSCARCWHSDGAAGECSPEISRWVQTEGKGRTPGCLIFEANRKQGSQARICSPTFGRHDCTTPSVRPFSRARTTIFATFQVPLLLSKRSSWELEIFLIVSCPTERRISGHDDLEIDLDRSRSQIFIDGSSWEANHYGDDFFFWAKSDCSLQLHVERNKYCILELLTLGICATNQFKFRFAIAILA